MTSIERLEAKLTALKETKNDFNDKLNVQIEALKALSIEYHAKAEVADKSTKATLNALVNKLDKAITMLEKVGV